jgi:hypothetical protein
MAGVLLARCRPGGRVAPVSTTFSRRRTRQTATRRSRGVQSALVILEVALSLVLVAAAGLLLDSVGRLRAVDVGSDRGVRWRWTFRFR